MRQNFVAQFIQHLKGWLWNVWSGTVMEKNWALSVDQCWLQALQFSVYLIDLLNMLLRCNGFSRILKAVVDQTSSRPPVTMTLFGASLTLGSALELFLDPTTELVVSGCRIKSTFHCMSQSDQEMVCCYCIEWEKITLQSNEFFYFWSIYEAPACWAFSPFWFASNAEFHQNWKCDPYIAFFSYFC